MEKKKLLIADQSEEFRQALQECLQEDYDIQLCWEGHETQKMLDSFRPDLVILDLMLPGVDGLTILKNLKCQNFEPAVLVTTRFYSDYLLYNLEALRVGYVMVKPCDVRAVAAHLLELAVPCRETITGDVEEIAKKTLLELHLPSHLRGYTCLREALIETVQNPGQQMKSLYLTLARRCGCSRDQAEKSIRDLLKKGWERRDDAVWSRYFGVDQNGVTNCPTNNECICTLTEHISAEIKKTQRYFSKIG